MKILPQDVFTQEERDTRITTGEKLFYTKLKIVKSVEKVSFRFGESFTMSSYSKNKSYKINYKDSNKIRVLVKDLDFVLNCLETGYFKIDNVEVPLNRNEINNSNFDVVEQQEKLKYMKKVVKVLDILNCSEDIDMKE